MKFALIAVCFLLFCHPAHRHPPRHRAVQKFCDQVTLAYANKQGSRDDFVRSFPVEKQRSVLECIGDSQ